MDLDLGSGIRDLSLANIRDLTFTSTELRGRPFPSIEIRQVTPGRPYGSSYGPRHRVNDLYH